MKRITRDIVDNMTQDEIKETLRDMRKQCHTCAQHAQMVDSPEYQLLIGKIDWTLFTGFEKLARNRNEA